MKTNKLFEAELAFTRAYRENQEKNKALREAVCVCTQMPYTLAPRKEGDYFGGRYKGHRIGFYPLMIGEGAADGYDKLCYCADIKGSYNVVEKMKQSGDYTEVEIQEAIEAISFWEKEETYAHIKAEFTPDFKQHMTHDYYHTAIGAVYPLYRIAGAHLDFEKLLSLGLNGLIEHIQKTKERKKES